MNKKNSSKEISMEDFKKMCQSKEASCDELENVGGGCGSKTETITVYCNKCGWETKWTGKHFVGDTFIGPCPVCGKKNIFRKF